MALPYSMLCSALLLSLKMGRRSWAGSILVGGGKGGVCVCVSVFEDYDPTFTSHNHSLDGAQLTTSVR